MISYRVAFEERRFHIELHLKSDDSFRVAFEERRFHIESHLKHDDSYRVAFEERRFFASESDTLLCVGRFWALLGVVLFLGVVLGVVSFLGAFGRYWSFLVLFGDEIDYACYLSKADACSL